MTFERRGFPRKQTKFKKVTIMSMYRYTTSCIQGIRHKMANLWIGWIGYSGRVRMIDFGYGYGRWQRATASSPSRSQSREFGRGLISKRIYCYTQVDYNNWGSWSPSKRRLRRYGCWGNWLRPLEDSTLLKGILLRLQETKELVKINKIY